jgi:hypothetical protein
MPSVRSNRVVIRGLLVLTFVTMLLGARSAMGQPRTAADDLTCPELPTHQKPSEEALQEGRTRYERALKLYEDMDLEQSLLEFQRAYDIAPAYRILYNIGTVAVILKRYPLAIEAFESFLCQGASDVDEKRRQSVKNQLNELYQRVGYISIVASVDGAEIVIDNMTMGRTPHRTPIMVNAGSRLVVLQKAGFLESKQSVTIAGTDQVELKFELVPIPTASERPSPPAPAPPPPKVEPTSYSWVGWLVAGTFAAGAVATGILALSDAKEVEQLQETITTRDEVEKVDDRRMALAITTDALIGAAAVTAVVTMVFVILENTSGDEGEASAAARRPNIIAGPGYLGVQGSF